MSNSTGLPARKSALGRATASILMTGVLLAAAVDKPASARDGDDALKARVAAILNTLTNGSDAEFEALRDRCIQVDGRRMCPGSDREPDAPARSKVEAEPSKEPGRRELAGSRTETAVTFVPGIRGEANTFTALEDLIRVNLEAGRTADAARYAGDLARLLDQAREDQVRPSTLSIIGRALVSTGQFPEADAVLRRALTLELTQRQRDLSGKAQTAPADALSSRLAMMLSGLASVAASQGRGEDARRLHQRALALSLDPDNADVLKAFALFERQQGRYAEATDLLSRSLELHRQFYGPSSSAADSANKLGHLALAQGRIEEAYRTFQDAAGMSTEIALAGVDDPMFHQREGDYIAAKRRLFEDVVYGAGRLADVKPELRDQLVRESFEAAQWAERTSAAAAVSRMAARLSAHAPDLSGLVREFDGLVAERQELEKRLLSRLAAQDLPAADQARAQVSTVETRARAIQARLAERFPRYAALAYPRPASIADVQAQLAPAEALVQFLFTQQEGYAWVLTRDQARTVRLPGSRNWLAERVAILRCGLDDGEWRSRDDGGWQAENERCKPLEAERNARKELPFRPQVAHELYRALFGPFEDLVAGKSLLVVPSGALSALPLHVLLTAPQAEKPGGPDYRALQWLALRHSVSVLPSAAALAALRASQPAAVDARRPFMGFGNPLLNGSSDPEQARRAKLAREKQECPPSPARTLMASVKSMLGMRALLRGETADVEAMRSAAPLPETADELCSVATALGADRREVLLGARATEGAVKSLSAAGILKTYRVVHFATHGLLATDTQDKGKIAPEPALLLSPPDAPSKEDDGLLTASEIARLELGADWVILSACNTAAGDAGGTEALSGLGRAFFYAGARALLVSHWPVYSDATVKLVTKALSRMAADKTLGRPEALRRSMLDLIAAGSPQEAHPAYWAPFVVVGEGGTGEGARPATTTGSIAPQPESPPPNAGPAARRPAKKSAPTDWRRGLWQQ
jgi:CHAT domain-containing protein/Tfp pilus assembly protein PilF